MNDGSELIGPAEACSDSLADSIPECNTEGKKRLTVLCFKDLIAEDSQSYLHCKENKTKNPKKLKTKNQQRQEPCL